MEIKTLESPMETTDVCQCCSSPNQVAKTEAATPSTCAPTTTGALNKSPSIQTGNLSTIPSPFQSSSKQEDKCGSKTCSAETDGQNDVVSKQLNDRAGANSSSTSKSGKSTPKTRRSVEGLTCDNNARDTRPRPAGPKPRSTPQRIDVVSVGDQMCEITAACRLTKDCNKRVGLTKLLIICDGIEPTVEIQTPTSFVKQLEWLRIHMQQLLRTDTETLDHTGERAQWKVSPKRNNFLFSVSQPHRFAGPYPQLPSSTPDPQSPATEAPAQTAAAVATATSSGAAAAVAAVPVAVTQEESPSSDEGGLHCAVETPTNTVASSGAEDERDEMEEEGDHSDLASNHSDFVDKEKLEELLMHGPGARHVADLFHDHLAGVVTNEAQGEKEGGVAEGGGKTTENVETKMG
eukprot:Selendium_serpulae@DN5440_c0_g1_i1.p1